MARKNIFKVLSVVMFCFVLFSLPVYAVPMVINVQGRVFPVPTITPSDYILVSLHDAETGGVVIRGIEGHASLDSALSGEGYFNLNVLLADRSGAVQEFLSDDYWVEVTLNLGGRDIAFAPRQRLVAVPFAITARNVNGGVGAFQSDRGASVVGVALDGPGAESWGVMGQNMRPGLGIGVIGMADGSSAIGVAGRAENGTGVWGIGGPFGGSFESTTGYGVYAVSSAVSFPSIYAIKETGRGNAIRGKTQYGNPDPAVEGWSLDSNGVGVFGHVSPPFGIRSGYGVKGVAEQGTGVFGRGFVAGGSFESNAGPGVYGVGITSGASFESQSGPGVIATSRSGVGVLGVSNSNDGVVGKSNWTARSGVYAENSAENGFGLFARSTNGLGDGVAIQGESSARNGTGIYGRANRIGVNGIADGGSESRGGTFFSRLGRGIEANSEFGTAIYGQTNRDNAIVGIKTDLIPVLRDRMLARIINKYGGLFISAQYGSGVVTIPEEGGPPVVDGNGRAIGAYGDVYYSGALVSAGVGTGAFPRLDVAEWIKSNDASIAAGDVVILDPQGKNAIIKSSVPADSKVAGIISTNPALIAGNKMENNDMKDSKYMEADGYRMLAVAGQVPCNVTTENGPIAVGDLLTTSSTPGFAMKAVDPKIGTIVGKAMEPFSAGQGRITVLLTLQ